MEKRPAAWLWVAALVPTLVLAVVRWSAGPGIGAEDYAQYQLHARALVEGRPYRDTGYLFSRLNAGHSPAVLPPGVPLVLAVAFKVAGEEAASVKLPMLAISVAFFLVAGLYFSIAASEPWLGVGVTLLIGLSPAVVRYTTLAQSDLPLCLCVWLVLLLADQQASWSWRRITAITLAGLAAMAFRLPGAVLIPVMLAVALLRWPELRWRGLVPGAAWLITALAAAAVAGTSVIERLPRFLTSIVSAPRNHLLFYRIAAGDALLFPFPWELANHYYQLVALAVSAVGLVLWGRVSWRRGAFVYAVTYLGLLVIAPFYTARYLWPLFPLLVFGFLKGCAAGIGWLSRRRLATSVAPASLGIAAVVALFAATRVAASPPQGWFVTQPDAVELLAELRHLHHDSPMRVSFSRPRILALETGIASMPLLNRRPDVIENELDAQCITHIVIGSLGLLPGHDKAYRDLVSTHPADFEPLWSNSEFKVFRYLALRPDNCPATIRGGFTAR